MNCECGNKLHQYFYHRPKGVRRYICHRCDNRYEDSPNGFIGLGKIEINVSIQELRVFQSSLRRNR